jgi:hypothetical protein
VNYHNSYRNRPWDTRVGTIDLAIPKLRRGSCFPDWLLDPRRAEKALVSVVAECYVRGVSTRRVDGLVKTLGIESLSKSQVSRMAAELDEIVEQFRNRPLDAGPYTYVWLDAKGATVVMVPPEQSADLRNYYDVGAVTDLVVEPLLEVVGSSRRCCASTRSSSCSARPVWCGTGDPTTRTRRHHQPGSPGDPTRQATSIPSVTRISPAPLVVVAVTSAPPHSSHEPVGV